MRAFEIIKKYEMLQPIIPKRQTSGSAGYDLASIEEIIIEPGEIKLIPTGLKVTMPHTEALFVFPRSSLAFKKGLMMSNSVGVIDSDYYNNKDNEGHIMIPLINIKQTSVSIQKGERVAQGIFMTFHKTTEDETENIHRLGGFGHTGL